MKQQKIDDIILPYVEGVPIHPSVAIGDKIIHAVEIMVKSDLKTIAVVRNARPIGMLRLEDAFKKLGLKTHSTP